MNTIYIFSLAFAENLISSYSEYLLLFSKNNVIYMDIWNENLNADDIHSSF